MTPPSPPRFHFHRAAERIGRLPCMLLASAFLLQSTSLSGADLGDSAGDGSRRTAVAPLPRAVLQGLEYLARQQRPDGGWNSGAPGGESDVASTSVAGLAFLRAGGSMREGDCATVLAGAEAFVTRTISQSNDETLLRPRGGDPLVQADLGPGIDATLSAWFLAELLAKGVPADAEPRVKSSLERLLAFIRSTQRAGLYEYDGSKSLSLALGARACKAARASGVRFDEAIAGTFAAAALAMPATSGASGAEFYAYAAVAGTLHAAPGDPGGQRAPSQFIRLADEPSRDAAGNPAAAERPYQSLELVRSRIARAVMQPQWGGVPGSGGEVFLSTMLIGDMLRDTDSDAWPIWNRRVGGRFAQLQNGDGSWTGSSCINGRVFCTSTAVLAMLSDRVATARDE